MILFGAYQAPQNAALISENRLCRFLRKKIQTIP